MRTLFLAILLAVTPMIGCISTSSAPADGPRSDRNRITLEELQAMPGLNAFEVVERLHRDWLRSRATTATTATGRTYPQVFVDGRPFGPLDALQQFGTNVVEEIRYISPSDATTRYGTGYTGGIIEVITRKDQPSQLLSRRDDEGLRFLPLSLLFEKVHGEPG